MAKRLGIMGGCTFNPIHNGHLFVADIARRELDLDEVRFIPTGDSPHKRHVDVSGWQRLAMVRLAIAGHEGFTASDMELRRGGRSYTCDTVRQLHMTEPGSKLFFIMGGDMLATFTTWRNPELDSPLGRHRRHAPPGRRRRTHTPRVRVPAHGVYERGAYAKSVWAGHILHRDSQAGVRGRGHKYAGTAGCGKVHT